MTIFQGSRSSHLPEALNGSHCPFRGCTCLGAATRRHTESYRKDPFGHFTDDDHPAQPGRPFCFFLLVYAVGMKRKALLILTHDKKLGTYALEDKGIGDPIYGDGQASISTELAFCSASGF
ncbi:hypothetical protein Trydic_g4160 [Trypoxylus dichotomus]